jgi:sphingomyelin phosphodiesterase
MLTGDLMAHDDWAYKRVDHINIIRNLTQLLDHYFPDTPVFWTIGNHEGVPVNRFHVRSVSHFKHAFKTSWVLVQFKMLFEPTLVCH